MMRSYLFQGHYLIHIFICFTLVIATKLFTIVSGMAFGMRDAEADGEIMKYLELDRDYRVYQKRLKWKDALNYCTKCTGEFATFPTPDDADKVRKLIYKYSVFSHAYDVGKTPNEWGLDRRYWFGLSDEKEEGKWMWISTYKNDGKEAKGIMRYPWYPRQPDHINKKTNEHCAGFWNPVYHLDTGKNGSSRNEVHYFNDFPCDVKLYFICKVGDAESPDGDECKSKPSKPNNDSENLQTTETIGNPKSGRTTENLSSSETTGNFNSSETTENPSSSKSSSKTTGNPKLGGTTENPSYSETTGNPNSSSEATTNASTNKTTTKSFNLPKCHPWEKDVACKDSSETTGNTSTSISETTGNPNSNIRTDTTSSSRITGNTSSSKSSKETTGNPKSGGTTENPSSSKTTGDPKLGGTTENPSSSKTTGDPKLGGTTESPSSSKTTGDPKLGGTTENSSSSKTTGNPK